MLFRDKELWERVQRLEKELAEIKSELITSHIVGYVERLHSLEVDSVKTWESIRELREDLEELKERIEELEEKLEEKEGGEKHE